MKPTLFEIAKVYRDDIEKLGDLDLPDEVIADTLEGMGGELAVKGRSIAAFAADLDTTASAIKDAEARMKARRQAVERRAERLRHYLLAGMQFAGIEKIDGPDFCVKLRTNPPAVEVFDAAQVPDEYLRKSLAVEIGAGHEIIPDDSMGIDWLTVSGPRESFRLMAAGDYALTVPQIKQAAELYLDGKSRREIARFFDVSEMAVRSALKHQKVPMRPRVEAVGIAMQKWKLSRKRTSSVFQQAA
jgi:hypothetical protein